MDFDSHVSEFTDDVRAKKDHSPSNDFEHIGSKIDSEFDLLDSGINDAIKSNESNAGSNQTAADLLSDFKSNADFMPHTKADNFDMFDVLSKSKEATLDFMASERSHIPPRMNASPPAPPVSSAIPSAPMKTSIYDDIENDYLNPYASAKNNEKFISSEDLLTDFKDVRSKTPEYFKEAPTKKDEPSEPILIPTPAVEPVAIKPVEPIVKKPVEPIGKKPVEVKQEVSHSKVEEIADVVKPSKTKPKEKMISAEEMFYKFGLGKCERFSYISYFDQIC